MNTNGLPEIHTDFIFIPSCFLVILIIAVGIAVAGVLIFLLRKKK
jgi:hypothetical protein